MRLSFSNVVIPVCVAYKKVTFKPGGYQGKEKECQREERGLKHVDRPFLTNILEAEELISGTPIRLRSCEMKIRIIGCRSDLDILYCDSEDMFLGGFLMVTPPQRGIKKELLRSGLPTEHKGLLVLVKMIPIQLRAVLLP
jgi:hypothetical protein